MNSITTRRMIDNTKIISIKDLHYVTKDGINYAVILGCTEFSGLEVELDAETTCEIDLIYHMDTPYYCIFINVENKSVYLLLPLLETSKTIAKFGSTSQLFITSQIVIEKALDPDNMYVGSVIIEKSIFGDLHKSCLQKIAQDPNISSRIKDNLSIQHKEIHSTHLSDFEINDFEQCVYIDTYVSVPDVDNIMYTLRTSPSLAFELYVESMILSFTANADLTQSIHEDMLSVCFRFNENKYLILDHDIIVSSNTNK